MRIGINVGDIVADDGDMFGDAVNVASRLESEADPGGICISGSAFDQVKLTFKDRCTFLGELSLKNIDEPVRAYKVPHDKAHASKPSSRSMMKPPPAKTVLIAALLLLISAGAYLTWLQFTNPNMETVADRTQRVAVLPFKNLSEDTNQQLIADGLADDLITDLSWVDGIAVISSNSSFAYRDSTTPHRQIADKLGARYLIDGTLRRYDDRLRISAKLVDMNSNTQIWAQSYDGQSDDVFTFQDKITGEIVQALKVILTPSQQDAITERGTRNIEAYEAYLRGMRLLAQRRAIDNEGNLKAQQEFHNALAIDPDYPDAYAGIAWAKWLHYSTVNFYHVRSRDDAFKNAEQAEQALTLGPSALAHRVLSRRYYSIETHVETTDEPELALHQIDAALALERGNPDLWAERADILPFTGAPAIVLEDIKRAITLNPDHPDWYLRPLGIAQLLTGDFHKAEASLSAYFAANKIRVAYALWVISAKALTGKLDEAQSLLKYAKEAGGLGGLVPRSFYALNRTWKLPPQAEETFLRGLELAGYPGPLAPPGATIQNSSN